MGIRHALPAHARGAGLGPGDGRHVLDLDGSEATARAVMLATGVSYRRLGVPGLEELGGTGVFYGASVSEARAWDRTRSSSAAATRPGRPPCT